MDLEQLLAEDRIKFETKLIPLATDKERQDAEALVLLNNMIQSCGHCGTNLAYIKQRMDAFMLRLVKYKVGPMTTLHVLRCTVSSAADFPNRPALAEHAKTFPAPKLFSLPDMDLQGRATVSTDTLRELKSLCQEHDDWFARMRELASIANPKNHPAKHQLRERDIIRLKINEVATPDVILSLVRIAMKERGEV